jgi:hypothetical protein
MAAFSEFSPVVSCSCLPPFCMPSLGKPECQQKALVHYPLELLIGETKEFSSKTLPKLTPQASSCTRAWKNGAS